MPSHWDEIEWDPQPMVGEDVLSPPDDYYEPKRLSAASRQRFMDAARTVMIEQRAAGCDCRPDVDFTDDRVTVYHDEWCTLLLRRPADAEGRDPYGMDGYAG